MPESAPTALKIVQPLPASDLELIQIQGTALIGSELEREYSARLVATWLAAYDSKTARPSMRRKARALALELFPDEKTQGHAAFIAEDLTELIQPGSGMDSGPRDVLIAASFDRSAKDWEAAGCPGALSSVFGQPWIRLAFQGSIETVRALRARLQDDATKHDATGGAKGRSSRTANSLLGAVRSLARVLWQLGVLDAEQLERLRDAAKSLPNDKRRAGKRIETLEVHLVAHAADPKTNAGLLDRAALALITTGMRRTEIVEARWERLESVRDALALKVIGKNKKERLVHLADPQVDALRAWQQACGDPKAGPILRPVNRGDRIIEVEEDAERGMTATALAARIKRLSAKVGVDLGGLHNMRRWNATTTIEAGVPVSVAQRQLGHESPTTTSAYLREDEGKDSDALRAAFPKVL